jgi:hypothetical protein
VLILIATAIAGGSGYLLTPIVAANLGPAAYAPFAVFWSALYLVISALSGVQQEVSRAARPRVHTTPATAAQRPVARNFALGGVFAVFGLTVLSALVWVGVVFPDEGFTLIWPLAVGVASYVLVAVVCGVLYGLQTWLFIGLMIGVDGVLRLVLVLAVLSFTTDLTAIAWAVSAPFLLTPLVLWPFFRRYVVGSFELDVGYRALIWNVARTIVGSASTGVLVSGFPLLLSATSALDPLAEVGSLILAITLTRAPIVIVIIALQSYLIIYFRTHVARIGSALFRIIGLVVALALTLAGLAFWVGKAVLVTFVGPEYVIDGGLLALLILSAATVGSLCATGPAVLSRSLHTAFTAGWLLSAVATVLLLLLPGTLEVRALIALTGGPIIGIAVHLVALNRNGRSKRLNAT